MIINKNPENYEKELELLGGISKKLLWQNASPESTFANQTVDMNLSEYDFVDIFYIENRGGTYEHHERIRVGKNGALDAESGIKATTASTFHVVRNVTTTTNGVQFGPGGYKYTGSSAYTENNNYSVPTAVYGIKGVQ